MIQAIRHALRMLALSGLASLLVLASPASPVGADDDEEEDRCYSRTCLYTGSEPEPAVYAGASFDSPDGGTQVIPTGSSVFVNCTWDRALAGEELLLTRPDVASVNITGSTFNEDHWIIYCPQLSGFDAYTLFPVGDPPPVPIIEDLIADAYSRTPVVAFNPITSPDGDDDIKLITQMTTFLWVDDTAWNTPVSATASLLLPGDPFSVTTTAIPREAFWSGGDQPMSCTGDDMHPYVFGIGGDDAQPSNCSMVYKRSSALQDNTVDLEVIWDVSYTCTIPGCGGPLPDIITISSRPVVVGEILAVGS